MQVGNRGDVNVIAVDGYLELAGCRQGGRHDGLAQGDDDPIGAVVAVHDGEEVAEAAVVEECAVGGGERRCGVEGEVADRVRARCVGDGDGVVDADGDPCRQVEPHEGHAIVTEEQLVRCQPSKHQLGAGRRLGRRSVDGDREVGRVRGETRVKDLVPRYDEVAHLDPRRDELTDQRDLFEGLDRGRTGRARRRRHRRHCKDGRQDGGGHARR